jgi:DNA/RNA-binding domain of Phe-tRNA-synthetase-like protein
MIAVDAHPLLDLSAFVTHFSQPLGQLATPAEFIALLASDAAAPLTSDDHIREEVRKLLRHGGFKPTGRSKPASEYLLKAVRESLLSPINPAVDVCNIVSLHSGLPISVVDLDRAHSPFRIRVAAAGTSYVFNNAGQEIDLGGMVCLCDAAGPCACAVKDSQRTKTDADTRQTLTVIWGTNALPGRTGQAEAWYRQLLQQLGATTEAA